MLLALAKEEVWPRGGVVTFRGGLATDSIIILLHK